MILLDLARKSLQNRFLTTSLTVVSIALSVALLVGVENVRVGIRESFSNTIRGTDLIIGAPGGTQQLLLYSVFGMGSATNNISYAAYEHWTNHPAVAWTIPYSLGDSHRGYRVIGTTEDFFRYYRFRDNRTVEFVEGHAPRGVFDVAVGHDVAAQLGYGLGDEVSVSHGMSAHGFLQHDDKPFTVVGIIDKTFTPIDRALYITLDGMTAIHIDWQDGGPPMPGQEVSAEEVRAMELQTENITAFFLGTRSRMETLRLQRDINTWEEEPLMAIIPGVALAEMWRAIGYAEDGLKVVTFFVVLVGLLGMLVSLYTSLNARRREMAVLRAVGAGPRKIISLLVLESGLLAVAGALIGVVLVYALLVIGAPLVEQHFGLFVPIRALGQIEYVYIAAVAAAGFLIGLVPAAKAYRNTLADGLTIRV
jgi:putative ABC transport system permease protein